MFRKYDEGGNIIMDSWTIAHEVDPIGKNSKGDPIRSIKTDAGGYLKLSANDPALLQQIFPGAKVRHGPVKQYGKQSFATMYEIEKPEPKQERPAFVKHQPTTTTTPPATQPAPYTQPAVPTWNTYAAVMRQAHRLTCELEPDDARARAALVNTAMIAFSNGKITPPVEGDPEIPGSDAPMPDDQGFPWERAS